MSNVLLITVPNNKESAATTFGGVVNQVDFRGGRISRFETPGLVVGTLDSLIALSDDLTKIGTQVENVVRKIERQYAEVADDKAPPLRVQDTAIEAYFKKFQWDFASYQFQGKQLAEIVGQIQAMASKAEEELKLLSTNYTDKSLAVAAAKRRQVVNLASSDFEDFLTPEQIAKLDVQNSEHLLTLMIVVPKSLEQEFLDSYCEIGGNIAAFGGPDWTNSSSLGSNDGKFGKAIKRNKVTGSPVVPGSKKKVREEGDSVMYAITVLRGHYVAGGYQEDVFVPGSFIEYLDQIKAAFRDRRFIVRELIYDSAKTGGVDGVIKKANDELKQVRATVLRWCKAHFGEVFGGFTHLKVVQAFVESVLRYGLPVDFVSAFVEVDHKNEKEVKQDLTRSILNLRPELRPKKTLVDEEEHAEGADGESLPFVCIKFPVIGASSSQSTA